MSILQKNLINKNASITKNIFGESEPNIFFNEEIKSINLPKYYFINFIDSKKDPLVNFLKRERRRFLKKEIKFDSEYEIKNIINKTNEQKKIDEIIKNTTGKTGIGVSLVFRLKSIYNPNVQFFFLDDLKGNYEVLFIDVYHLVLPAPDKLHKELFAKPQKKYNEHKNARYDIKEIFHK